ncbi:DNA mismatch repair protein MutS [Clostridiales bacterium F-3ap]|uniref:DNA mismatch repair protein MutS n=2 Tax=Anaerotalea alkaliphila TaxID=2662126 RepID=A0A7X5KMT4_9FIRM|nr:DNA mismatch repair protein MutS [Anaerotalea alkaliphila]
MMLQYREVKERYRDCILFYRLGDFYEMFFEDALQASRALEITLTGRECGLEEKAPMCGVPHHAAETYIQRLVDQGMKVAICEQVEDPKSSKGIVRRDVVRVVTPGTVLNTGAIPPDRNNYLMAVVRRINTYGIAYVDITTGAFHTTVVHTYSRMLDELAKVDPAELLANPALQEDLGFREHLANRFHTHVTTQEDWYFERKRSEEAIRTHFQVSRLEGLLPLEHPEAVQACGALFNYLQETQKGNLVHITNLQYYQADRYMLLDASTRRNLELTQTLREKNRRGSLLWVLDKTRTAMGSRMLRSFLEEPLLQEEALLRRQDAVQEFLENPMAQAEVQEAIGGIYDLERLMGKVACHTANARDLLAFKQSLSKLPALQARLAGFSSALCRETAEGFDCLQDLHDLLERAIAEEPPLGIRDGGILRSGYDSQVDAYREAMTNGKQWLAALEAQERKETGIKTLKVKYNKVFGYHLEVSSAQSSHVPDRYIRKQTLANAERYVTPALKEMESTILGAEEKLMALEYALFLEIRETLSREVERIKRTARDIALVDALQSLGEVARTQKFVRPTLNREGVVRIQGGRHPVIEKMLGDGAFIQNDTYLDKGDHRFNIITGPNMAGKSTYMRQVALIVLMAQTGSFVPAQSADLCLVDRIFTRVGASDDLASGQSTFMVEMTEVAQILRNATKDSLVLLDEIGRGTSTFDGLSIAWAVVEYLSHGEIGGAKTLFATHYHELTELEGKVEGVQNYRISVKEKGDDIIFLRKILPGSADKSYGIQVAKLAGVPPWVIKRSKEILKELSKADIAVRSGAEAKGQGVQLDLFTPPSPQENLLEEVRSLDLARTTPLEALLFLHRLQEDLK